MRPVAQQDEGQHDEAQQDEAQHDEAQQQKQAPSVQPGDESGESEEELEQAQQEAFLVPAATNESGEGPEQSCPGEPAAVEVETVDCFLCWHLGLSS